jgi:UDP-N-acetyl-D-mannosaminuronate dehydrogenase
VQEKGKTLVVGLGEVGGALAEVLERTGPVLRHDIEPRSFNDPIEVMHLCVPFSAREQFEEIALSYIERFKLALTIVNSTVLPGTTRSIARRSGRPAAYSPVRGKHVRMVHDLLHYKKFVAACDVKTARRAERHFRQAGIRTRRLDQPETLELAKLAETTYFGLLIAFAQELNRYAGAACADYDQAVTFFEEVGFLPRVRYFPGFIGGHCVIPNINLLRQIARSPLLEAVLDSNHRRAEELHREAAQPSADARA